jgi:tetratricopeptide (TPR) repeat protein
MEIDAHALPQEVQAKLDDLCAAGDQQVEAGEFASAIARYREAWALLPEPKENWEAALWVVAAIGDAEFFAGDYLAARRSFTEAVRTLEALGNPFVHLRLGECAFELGEFDRAADELMRAYMGGGPEAFTREDPKYLEFLSTRAKGIELPKKKPRWKFWR